jgi:hypothetical protein
MAARFKSKLFVLHVVPPRLSYYPLPAAATPEALQRDQEHQERCREDFDLFITELGDVSVEGRLVEGDAHRVFCGRKQRRSCYDADQRLWPPTATPWLGNFKGPP